MSTPAGPAHTADADAISIPSPVSIQSSRPGIPEADIAAWHADQVSATHPDARFGDVVDSPAGPAGSRCRYVRLSDEEHAVALFTRVRGVPAVITATAPTAVDIEALSTAVLDTFTAESALILSAVDVRIVEEAIGAAGPSAYVGEGRAAGLDDDERERLRADAAAALTSRGVLVPDGVALRPAPTLSDALRAAFDPTHLVWLTWHSAERGSGSAVFGRAADVSVMVRGTGGDLVRVDRMDRVDVPEYAWGLVASERTGTAPPLRTISAAELRDGAPARHALYTARAVRRAAQGLDAADVSWIHHADGWSATIEPGSRPDEFVLTAIDAVALRARVSELFETGEGS